LPDHPLDFDTIWARWVKPLAGTPITGMDGLTNEIRSVDSDGVVRVSRNGRASRIPLEPFRWTVDRVLAGHEVERIDINDAFPHRYSSGVFLILEQVPEFEAFRKSTPGNPKALRLRRQVRGV
jgi:hypothetical protein